MAIALILVVLVVQMAVTMVGAVWSDRELSNAQRDTMGRYDRLGRAAAKAIPKASLVEFDDVGHLPQVEVFDDYLQALLSFLVPAEQALPTS